MKNNSGYFVAIFLVLIFFIAACSASQAPAPEQNTDKTVGRAGGSEKIVAVSINGFKFVPAEVNIKVGETVVWANEDSTPHTVESSDGTLKSDELSKGDSYKFKFTKAGKYDYICGIHASMHGSVTVQ